MKIAFWSHLRHHCGVTTNLACMAAMTAITGSGKSILLENHYNMNSLGSILMVPEQISCLKEKAHYYHKYGMEYLLKRLYTGESGEALVRKASVPLLYSSIFYIPQSYIVNREVFDYEFELVYKRLFECLEKFSDLVFIDTESNRNLSSIAILQDADLIVVNLNQNPAVWAEFLDNYPSLIEKSIFIVGQYQRESEWSLSRIQKEFSISKTRIGMVPHNMECREAMREGRLLQFVNRNYQRASNEETDYFLKESRKTGFMLRKQYQSIRREKIRLRKAGRTGIPGIL